MQKHGLGEGSVSRAGLSETSNSTWWGYRGRKDIVCYGFILEGNIHFQPAVCSIEERLGILIAALECQVKPPDR